MSSNILLVLQKKLVEVGIPKVYVGDLPSLELECVSLRLPDGYASSRYFGMQTLAEPLVEVLVRSKAFVEGQNWYTVAANSLDNFVDEENGIISCLLTGSPGYLGKSTTGFNEWHMLFHVTLKE